RRARFSEHMLAGAREIHPVRVLDGLSVLEVTRHPGGARIAGSGSREDLTRVLTDVLARGQEQGPLHFELDLADARDVDAHCAWMLIDLAAALPAPDRLVMRCERTLETVVRGLCADAVPQLELAVTGGVQGPKVWRLLAARPDRAAIGPCGRLVCRGRCWGSRCRGCWCGRRWRTRSTAGGRRCAGRRRGCPGRASRTRRCGCGLTLPRTAVRA